SHHHWLVVCRERCVFQGTELRLAVYRVSSSGDWLFRRGGRGVQVKVSVYIDGDALEQRGQRGVCELTGHVTPPSSGLSDGDPALTRDPRGDLQADPVQDGRGETRSAAAGLRAREPPDLLQVPEPDRPELRCRHPGPGRRATISAEFRNLASVYQEIIADTCRRSGAGLARFLEQKVKTLQEWDDYGHYSFGLVDMGYYCVCAAFEQKDALIEQDTKLLNSMGLLMQKTNTIRDYLEDQVDGREFWPRAVWSKYAMKLSDFSDPENIVPAVQCLNELITNALQHVPDVLTFLSRLRVHCFFTCCAVPHIYQKIPRTDPSAHQTQHVILSIRKMTTSSESTVLSSHSSSIYLSCAMLVAAVGYLYLCSESLVLDEIHESQSGF
uniref:Squalene synthase n=1 Tax=Leptobrachium leishanense TaxID=445787 RepID=A0A8C5MPY1_9ANUR